MKYIITGILPDSPETWKNGGGRALIYLFNLLHYIGLEAEFDGPIADDDVVIYPDCVKGNPLNAKRIVHWMLYFWSGERIPASECVICYHEAYLQQVAEKYDGPTPEIVYLPTIEPGLFYPEEKTIEALVYPGKLTVPNIPIREALVDAAELPPAVPVISKSSMSRQEFAATLRKTKRLYSLDHHTIVFTEAALCGCETWRVNGGDEVDRIIIENPEQHVMNFERDAAVARRFHEIVTTFFK